MLRVCRYGFDLQVQGMTELNACEPVPIKVTGPYTFTIGDTTGLSAYKSGGYVKQVKMQQTVSYVRPCLFLFSCPVPPWSIGQDAESILERVTA